MSYLLIILLASSTGYYWYTSRLYNERENSLKEQLKTALAKIDSLSNPTGE
jgi:hypothetical protein